MNIRFFLPSLASLFVPGAVGAQGLKDAGKNLGTIADKSGVSKQDVGTIAGTAINAALTLVGLIFLILMVYAGFLWMTARGEESQIEKAKGMITAAIIGLVIVLSAYAITALVTGRLGAL